MSQYLYDEALVDKIKHWTKESDVHIYGPNETSNMFKLLADKKNDKPIELPLITISRDRGFVIRDDYAGRTRKPSSYDGVTLHANEYKSMVLTGIPIALDYTIDIYTKLQLESDILVRNLIFNLVNQPAMKITVPGTSKFDGEEVEPFEHTAVVTIDSNQVQDRSNMPERFIEGNLTRLTLLVSINDAYLWDVREHVNGSVDFILDDVYEPLQLIYKSDLGTAPSVQYFNLPYHIFTRIDLPNISVKGKVFKGWFYDKKFTNQAKVGDMMKDTTILYAKFE